MKRNCSFKQKHKKITLIGVIILILAATGESQIVMKPPLSDIHSVFEESAMYKILNSTADSFIEFTGTIPDVFCFDNFWEYSDVVSVIKSGAETLFYALRETSEYASPGMKLLSGYSYNPHTCTAASNYINTNPKFLIGCAGAL